MAVIRITEPMADTILAAVKRDTGEWIVRGRVQTENALSARGLIDYGDDYAFLTEHGKWVRRILCNIHLQRSFDLGGLDEKMVAILAGETQGSAAPVRTAADFTAGSRVSEASTGRLGTVLGYWNGSVTNPDHENFGREYIGVKWDGNVKIPWGETARPFVDELRMDIQRNPDQFPATEPEGCGAVDAGDLDACGVCSDCNAPTTTVTEYSVKIWYRSGAYEGAPHCPEDLARKIFADAVKSAGVEFAELHGPSGKLVESKPRAEENTGG